MLEKKISLFTNNKGNEFLTGDYDLKSIVVFKPEQVRTKEDLIDIWKKRTNR